MGEDREEGSGYRKTGWTGGVRGGKEGGSRVGEDAGKGDGV